jgi:hypothetical protein
MVNRKTFTLGFLYPGSTHQFQAEEAEIEVPALRYT